MKGCRVRVESVGMHTLVQHMLFEMGGKWASRGREVLKTHNPGIILLSTDGIIFQGNDYERIVRVHGWVKRLPEVTPQELAHYLQTKREKR